MRHGEFLTRTGLYGAALSRLTARGVVRPYRPHGRGQGRPAVYSEVDVTAVLVWRAAVRILDADFADKIAACAREGCAYVYASAQLTVPCPDLELALALVDALKGAATIVDVAKVTTPEGGALIPAAVPLADGRPDTTAGGQPSPPPSIVPGLASR